MPWVIQKARDTIHDGRQEWDAINRQLGNHILLDSGFVAPLVRYFATNKTLLAIRRGKGAAAAAIVEPGKPGFWQTLQPGQSPFGLMLWDGRNGANVVGELMRALPGFAVNIAVTQQDPDFTQLSSLNGSPAYETLDYIETPRLTVHGKFEDFWRQRSKNLTHNLNRQRRRLKDQGCTIELLEDRGVEAVAGAIEEYGLLESTGWKGQEGSAVARDNAQGRFYREMLEEFSRRDEAVIYRLRLNGKTVASDLCLERAGTMFILKTAYDESVQSLSLGLLMHQEIFQKAFDGGQIRVIEFYGQLRDWHTKWTNETRMMFHINFYRSEWIPRIRRFVKNAIHTPGLRPVSES